MRLGDLDALRQTIILDTGLGFYNECMDGSDTVYSQREILCCIDKVPTLDYKDLVPQGEWIHTDLAASWNGKDECSECQYHTADRIDLSFFNFCPDCGARMKGGE